MITTGRLLGFALASLVVVVIPGPGVLFIVGRALAYGRRRALATGCGHAAGNYVVAACIAFGLGPIVERSDAVFTAVKLAGAAYLLFLGVQAIRHRRRLRATLEEAGVPRARPRPAALEGFVVGVTNPKALLVFGAILPQFVNRAAGDVTLQMLLLSLVTPVIGVVSDSLWGLAASGVRSWFAASERRLELVGGAGGLAMIAVGATLAVTGRKS